MSTYQFLALINLSIAILYTDCIRTVNNGPLSVYLLLIFRIFCSSFYFPSVFHSQPFIFKSMWKCRPLAKLYRSTDANTWFEVLRSQQLKKPIKLAMSSRANIHNQALPMIGKIVFNWYSKYLLTVQLSQVECNFALQKIFVYEYFVMMMMMK